MTDILLPASFGMGRANVLREFLDSRDGRRFQTQVVLSDALSRATQQTARRHRMRNPEVLDGLATALVSCVQAMAPHEEWADVGKILAETIQRRLTVMGD